MFEDSITDEVRSKYMLLPLDTFHFAAAEKNSTAYCLIENTPIQEMFSVDQYLDLHQNLIKNYYLRNWNYCEQAIEQLLGRWNGELDSFYENLLQRVKKYQVTPPGNNFTGYIDKSNNH
jgi:hypothetical protein